jgi:hypothetical protein
VPCDLLQDDDGRVAYSALDPADIGAVQPAFKRTFFLLTGLALRENFRTLRPTLRRTSMRATQRACRLLIYRL